MVEIEHQIIFDFLVATTACIQDEAHVAFEQMNLASDKEIGGGIVCWSWSLLAECSVAKQSSYSLQKEY